MLSSLPNLVDRFRTAGLRSEWLAFAFDPRILDRILATPRTIGCSFVGTLSRRHGERLRLLEAVAHRTTLDIWGQGLEALPADSPLRTGHHGSAWGAAMYRVLRSSQATLNHHIDIAGSYANNMRLFEATGMGALLITDHKTNLADLFVPGRDVVAYRNLDECIELIAYYLDHPVEREQIALAGQQRTLRDHTYTQRMAELVTIINRHL